MGKFLVEWLKKVYEFTSFKAITATFNAETRELLKQF